MDAGSALFPISLSNQRFGSDITVAALQRLPEQYSEIYFLVADVLQLYNKALRVIDGRDLAVALETFRTRAHYFDEREQWLAKVWNRLGGESLKSTWRLFRIEDFADGTCFKILRNIMLAFYSVRDFQEDVRATAEAHANTRTGSYPSWRSGGLSQGYILEELAISIRIHVLAGVLDEFYLGSHAPVVLKLYAGAYGFSVFDLAEVPKRPDVFRFWEGQVSSEEPSWVRVGQ